MTGSGHYIVGKVPFRIGVSYAPRSSDQDFWKRFDVDEVHEDFSILAELGVNLARVALDWAHFQPGPESLSCSALAHLLGLCDAAASEGVRLELLVFGSHLIAPERSPAWLQEHLTTPVGSAVAECGTEHCARPRLFSNSLAKQAAASLVRGVARTVGSHPAIWAYNLGDRPDRVASQICRDAANAWFRELGEVVHSVDPRHPVTCSLGGTSLSTNAGLRVDHVFSVLDHSTIDADGLSSELGPSDLESQVLFSCALTAALSGKPCLAQESCLGTGSSAEEGLASTENAMTRDTAMSLLAGLRRLGAIGTMIGPAAVNRASEEAGAPARFGLLDDDGRPNELADAIREFMGTKPLVQKPAERAIALGLTADEYYESPGANFRKLYREFQDRGVDWVRG